MTLVPHCFEAKIQTTDFVSRPEGWVPGCQILILTNPVNICIINQHASTKREAREMSCTSIAERYGLFARLIWCGDFNSFPDAGGIELLHNMQRLSGAYEVTSVILDAKDPLTRIIKTFEPYPDDAFMPKGQLVPFALDHILAKGITHDIAQGHSDTLGTCSDHMLIQMNFSIW